MDARTEFRDFLTSRRARITPEQVELPADGGSRRVTGLRREEVALLAGVSADYYIKLERGNARGVSASVLEALSRARRLDEAERSHLFALANAASTGARTPARTPKPRVRPSASASWTPCPRPRPTCATAAGDLPRDEAQFMADSQVPWGLDALNGVMSAPAWRSKPTWYFVAGDDRHSPAPTSTDQHPAPNTGRERIPTVPGRGCFQPHSRL